MLLQIPLTQHVVQVSQWCAPNSILANIKQKGREFMKRHWEAPARKAGDAVAEDRLNPGRLAKQVVTLPCLLTLAPCST